MAPQWKQVTRLGSCSQRPSRPLQPSRLDWALSRQLQGGARPAPTLGLLLQPLPGWPWGSWAPQAWEGLPRSWKHPPPFFLLAGLSPEHWQEELCPSWSSKQTLDLRVEEGGLQGEGDGAPENALCAARCFTDSHSADLGYKVPTRLS